MGCWLVSFRIGLQKLSSPFAAVFPASWLTLSLVCAECNKRDTATIMNVLERRRDFLAFTTTVICGTRVYSHV